MIAQFILFLFFALWVVAILFILICKSFSESTNSFILTIQNDDYYCYLLVLMIIPTYAIIYLNWLCMKVFQTNYVLQHNARKKEYS